MTLLGALFSRTTPTDAPPMPSPDLQSTKYAARRTALAARKEALQAALGREQLALQRALVDAQARHDEAVREAEEAAETKRHALTEQITRDLYDGEEGLDALVADFRREPSRATATKIADLHARFDARCKEELGIELPKRTLLWSFARSIVKERPTAANGFNQDNFGSSSVIEAAWAFTKAKAPAQYVAALTALEASLLVAASMYERVELSDRTTRSIALKLSSPFDGEDKARAFGKEQHELEEAERRRNYVVPDTIKVISVTR